MKISPSVSSLNDKACIVTRRRLRTPSSSSRIALAETPDLNARASTLSGFAQLGDLDIFDLCETHVLLFNLSLHPLKLSL